MRARTQIALITKSVIASIEVQKESLKADKNVSDECKELALFELQKTIDSILESWAQ